MNWDKFTSIIIKIEENQMLNFMNSWKHKDFYVCMYKKKYHNILSFIIFVLYVNHLPILIKKINQKLKNARINLSLH